MLEDLNDLNNTVKMDLSQGFGKESAMVMTDLKKERKMLVQQADYKEKAEESGQKKRNKKKKNKKKGKKEEKKEDELENQQIPGWQQDIAKTLKEEKQSEDEEEDTSKFFDDFYWQNEQAMM